MKKIILLLCFSLLGCQTISEKIDDASDKEEKNLNKFLNGSEYNLKSFMGRPDKIDFKEGSNNRYYIYESKKFNIKCERIFEINYKNKVVGYSSKNCF